MRDTRVPPSKRQQAVLDCILAFQKEHNFPPTLREIAELVGLHSMSPVSEHLKSLEKKGFIARNPANARSICILEQGPTRVEVLEELLRRGVELVLFVRTRAEFEAWGAEVQAVLPSARAEVA